jgi:hypothetical protein
MDNPSRSIALVVLVLLLVIVLFRGINFRRLNSSNTKDRALKIFYIVGLMLVLLFVVSEVLLQTHII